MSLQTKTEPQANTGKTPRGKPVLVYIMILFIAAFLLMALSFAAHQRSVGSLEDSFSATLKDLQAEQAHLPELTEENAALKQQLTQYEQQLEEVTATLGSLALELETTLARLQATEQLCSLQQQYAAQNYAACSELIESMETGAAALPAPQNSLFLEIKQAVADALAAADTVLEEK